MCNTYETKAVFLIGIKPTISHPRVPSSANREHLLHKMHEWSREEMGAGRTAWLFSSRSVAQPHKVSVSAAMRASLYRGSSAPNSWKGEVQAVTGSMNLSFGPQGERG